MATVNNVIDISPHTMRPAPDNDDTGCRLSMRKHLDPRGIVHGFVNATWETSRTLAMLTPGLIGPAYFREMTALLAAGGSPDPARVAEVMGRHGLVVAAVAD